MPESEVFRRPVTLGHELLLRHGRTADIRTVARIVLLSQLEDGDQLTLIDQIARKNLYKKERDVISGLAHVVNMANDQELTESIDPFILRKSDALDAKLETVVPRLNAYLSERPEVLVAVHKNHGADTAHIVERIDFVSSHKRASNLGLFDDRDQHIEKISSVHCVLTKFTAEEQDYIWSSLD